MNIKQTLLLLINLLVLVIFALTTNTLIKQKSVYDNAQLASQLSPVIIDLLYAAQFWAVERGVTNSALAYALKAPQDVRDSIANKREKADKAYMSALANLETIKFDGKDEAVASLEKLHDGIVKKRKLVDAALDKSQMLRSNSLFKSWVPDMTKLILESQQLRYIVGQRFSLTDAQLASQNQLKHNAWLMSEYAGRERAIVGGLISSKLAINTKTYNKLSKYRGHVEEAYDNISQLAGISKSREIKKSVESAEYSFFVEFQSARDKIYGAGLEGEPYPLTTSEWIKASTEAINSVLAIKDASITDTKLYIEELKSKSAKGLAICAILIIFNIFIALASWWSIYAKVISPLKDMTESMQELAMGNTDITVPALGRKDEMGVMASSVQVFKENALEKIQMEQKQAEAEAKAAEEKRRLMNELAQSFEQQVGGLVNSLSDASAELQSTAENMRNIADETTSASQTVAASSEEASANVSTVASAMEEMSTSSAEISTQILTVRNKSNDTSSNAAQANETVSNLSELVGNIGEVVVAIQDIAEQTNLLALNATIEAARAGEAGKGFAVVADEVKKLASETSQKTEEINSRITEIQGATHESVDAMQRIIENIQDIDQSVTGVSAAVEEQNATTTEVLRSVSEASEGVQNVSQIILEVQKGATNTGSSANTVLESANSSAALSKELENAVEDFVNKVRSDNG